MDTMYLKPAAAVKGWLPIPIAVIPSFMFGKSLAVSSKPADLSLDKRYLIDVGSKRVEVRRRRRSGDEEEKAWNWMLKVLQSREEFRSKVDLDHNENGECEFCMINDDEEEFDRASFSKLLRRVSLSEARLYAQMAYLGHLTYSIPNIKPRNLLKLHGLRFVTSSMEKMKKKLASLEDEKEEENLNSSLFEGEMLKNMGNQLSGYQIAASAASYFHAQTISFIPNISFPKTKTNPNRTSDVEANNMLNETVISKVTAVVASEEEVKQALADDLTSEWFICDDDQSQTRYFLIQGSDSLASWKANLLFEPIQFEGYDVLVHRGIYEAAKRIYKQMLPEIRLHLKRNGNRATFRLGGHSLGGSLSVLVSLMLIVRGQIPCSSLLPVVTFGSPSIMCGGDALLKELGLPRSQVQAITLHRDIVPRAFSCRYPTRITKLLMAVNVKFRNLPCLHNQNLLYAPMGEFLILQPSEKLSPSHDLLPAGCGLYILRCCEPVHVTEVDTKIRTAQYKFLNSPHPLEILSKRSSYGSDGTIMRDHDMKIYMKCIRQVISQELREMKKAETSPHPLVWWPINTSQEHSSYLLDVLQAWKESLSLIISQHKHLFVLLLFPSRLLSL
ncbi:phospholipase A1 PLIP2, chloroplastic-like [Impatiens glandulifera]|uniref:phospholipase A1 PLIP2, chloroplastic-like n=1 Tax=Impatiens glandulifera TaxID=253017 RepID=UPI001FB0BECA|nr:phospholipase A1 PLIP2, chloroplastic-like [Impatiens glandulifera]